MHDVFVTRRPRASELAHDNDRLERQGSGGDAGLLREGIEERLDQSGLPRSVDVDLAVLGRRRRGGKKAK